MKKIFLVILLMITISLSTSTQTSFANPMIPEYLRVGLKQYYEEVDAIKVNNNSLVMGYGVKGDWAVEQLFLSDSGYTFKPYTNYLLISDQSYNTYDEALEQSQIARQQGFQAYPGTMALGIWKVFIGDSKSKEEAQALVGQAAIEGLTFQIASDNGLRTIMTSSSSSVIFDNVIMYPQFVSMDTTYEVPVIDLDKRKYRGKLEFGRYNKKGITAINIIGLEEYLYGVIPAEMVYTWPIEALKAQAVAARNYAVYYSDVVKKYPNEAYDICDTTYSQVYKGFGIEKESTNQAVIETKDKLIYFNDKVVKSYFFSTSGGHTENSENVWIGSVPYLKGVPDIYETYPERKPWTKELTGEEIKNILAKYDVHIGNIVDVIPLDYTSAGRVLNLKIVGTNGEQVLKKETMRYWLDLYGREFEVIKSGDIPQQSLTVMNAAGTTSNVSINQMCVVSGSGQTGNVTNAGEQLMLISNEDIDNIPLISGKSNTFIFAGQGWGHGVGMSQSGAKGMAYAGFTYEEILEYYYTGVEVR